MRKKWSKNHVEAAANLGLDDLGHGSDGATLGGLGLSWAPKLVAASKNRIPSTNQHQSAPVQHGHQVEHGTPRVWGAGRSWKMRGKMSPRMMSKSLYLCGDLPHVHLPEGVCDQNCRHAGLGGRDQRHPRLVLPGLHGHMAPKEGSVTPRVRKEWPYDSALLSISNRPTRPPQHAVHSTAVML